MRYLVICEHSEAAGSKHFISGGGLAAFPVMGPPGLEAPLIIPRFSVALAVEVPYSATSEPHTVSVSIEDEDGVPLLPQPLAAKFETGRPPGMRQNDETITLMSFNIQGLQVPKEGKFLVVAEVDGFEESRQAFWARKPTAFGMPQAAS